MFGAIAGDIIGSPFEFIPMKDYDFPLFQTGSTFTDDTVLTIATAFSILKNEDYASSYKKFGRLFPLAGYGLMFNQWLNSESKQPYNSWGNGSAMRVSPIGFAYESVEEVLREAKKSASVTHNHSEGIKGAQATALSIFLARNGYSKSEIHGEIASRFDYDLSRTLDEIRPGYQFNESCQQTVPESIIAFLESNDFEDAIRKAVSLGGDSDTQACITGGIGEAYYKSIPEEIMKNVNVILPDKFKQIIRKFNDRFSIGL